jgi:hypothetical protein
MSEFIVKHWRGQLPLSQSCWTALVFVPFMAWFGLVGGYLAAHPPTSLGLFVPAMVLPFFVLVPAAAWSGAGIWNSAARHLNFARPLWIWSARASVVMGAVALVLTASLIAKSARSILLAPEGEPAAYEVTLRGNTAVFHGEIGKAAADELELLLKEKSVKRLAIAGSNGGDLAQALRLATIIHARKLFVVALSQCDAACTLLLAAGQVRAVVPDTIMGFGAVPGSPAALRFYRQAGLSTLLVDGLRKLPPDTLFEPSLRTLIVSGFLNNVFVNAKRRYVSARAWCAHNKMACDHTGRQNMDAAKVSGGVGNGQ